MIEKDSEKLVERRLVEEVNKAGGMCIKLLCSHMIGLPDRLCLFKNGRIVFIELKTTGEKPRRIQKYMHEKIRKLGFTVIVIDTVQCVIEFIKSMY